ncbi:MAG: protein kinase [Planctomycetaceae bacterium]|nr:protein kinase [Planctomycetaceae bacterium]
MASPERPSNDTAQAADDDAFLKQLADLRSRDRERLEMTPASQGYDLVREVRRGAQGIVYEAVQRSTRRRVALKRLQTDRFHSVRDRFRFQLEIQTLSALRHPSIVTLHESGELDGQPFYAMEFVDGQPINEALQIQRPDRSQNPARQRKRIHSLLKTFIDVCDAVACFQRHGIIHRDLKPENILIDATGQPRIVDFGLTCIARPNSTDTADETGLTVQPRYTRTGEFLGTLAYASPEQLSAEPDRIDIRSDVYALGAILYELLTGQLPRSLSGSVTDVVRQLQQVTPRRLGEYNPALSGDLETIVHKALHHDPVRRYQSAAELQADLKRFLSGLPILARADSTWYMLRKSLSRYRTAVITAITFVLMLVAATATSLTMWSHAVNQRNTAFAETYRATIYAADAAHRQHRISDAMDLIHSTPRELRGWEWKYVLSRIDHAVKTHELGPPPSTSRVAWNDAVDACMVLRPDGRLDTFRFVDSKLTEVIGPPLPENVRLFLADLSPTQDGMAVVSDGRQVWMCTTNARPQQLPLPEQQHDSSEPSIEKSVKALRFSGNGGSVAALVLEETPDGSSACLVSWDVEVPSAVEAICPVSDSATAFCLSPDGKTAYISGLSLEKVDLAVGRRDPGFQPPSRLQLSAHVLQICPSGKMLAGLTPQHQIVLFDSSTGELLRRLGSHDGPVTSLAFSSDGQFIASGSLDSITRVFRTEDGENVRSFQGHVAWVQGVVFSGRSPDDQVLSVSSRSELKVFSLSEPSGERRLPRLPSSVSGLRYCNQGSGLVLTSLASGVLVADVETGTVRPLHLDAVADGALLEIDAEGRRCVIAERQGQIRIVELIHGETPTTAQILSQWNHPNPITAVVMTHDGDVIVGDETGKLTRYAPAAKTSPVPLSAAGEYPVRQLALADGGHLLVAEDEFTLTVIDLKAGQLRHRLPKPQSQVYSSLAIHPNGRLAAVGNSAGMIHTFHVVDGIEQAPFQWHAMSVTALCFNEDGTRLFSAAADGTLRVWDTERRVELLSLPNVDGFVTFLDFDPDRNSLAAGLYDGHVILIEPISAAERYAARKKGGE